MNRKICTALAISWLLPVAGSAQLPSAPSTEALVQSVRTGCAAELKAHCKDVTPGEGRQLACLYAHEDKLSNRCEYALYDASAELQRAVTALSYVASECDDELSRFCAQVDPGSGRVLQCLKRHEKELSERCNTARKEVEK